MTLISRRVCKVVFMDTLPREEWMYKLRRVGNDKSFLHHVRNFIAAARKHRVSLGRERTICPCGAISLDPLWFCQELHRLEVSRRSRCECHWCILVSF